MSDEPFDRRQRAVPRGRLSRLGQFGRLAGGVAGGVLAEGARRIAAGERPRMRDMLLTPGNVSRVAERLSHLRGAAMKLGQMVSMDAGELLPPELSQVLARLRDDAHHMPPAQLNQVLKREWGKDWLRRFERFDARPIAAASIGQVHRAVTREGRVLAIKVQYPGVRESIDADVDNVATLLRAANLLPRELDITPLLQAAKAQLAEEADYLREGEQMTLYGTLLKDDPNFVVPKLDSDLTTPGILAMTFVEGRPIEALAAEPQRLRDDLMRKLITLVVRELFEFGTMQTDPNFANYRFQPATGRLVLLDFGATRAVSEASASGYRQLLQAGLAGNREAVRNAALATGFIRAAALSRHDARIDRMIDIILAQLNRPGPFDFADRGFLAALREEGVEVAADRATWHVPPADLLFIQRKISGTALLAAHLQARVDVRAIVEQRLRGQIGFEAA